METQIYSLFLRQCPELGIPGDKPVIVYDPKCLQGHINIYKSYINKNDTFTFYREQVAALVALNEEELRTINGELTKMGITIS